MNLISQLPEKEERKICPKHPDIIYKILRFIQGRLHPICILSNILVPPLYWILVYHGQFPSYNSIGAHGVSAFFCLLDIIFEIIHISWFDFLVVFLYAPFYVCVVWIYYWSSGNWVYSALNPSKGVSTAFVYLGCFAFYYIGFFVILFITYVKMISVGFLKKKFQKYLWDKKRITNNENDKNQDQELQNMSLTSVEATNVEQQPKEEKFDDISLDEASPNNIEDVNQEEI
eukprot:gene10403-2932_t